MRKYLVVSDSHYTPVYLEKAAKVFEAERCTDIIHLGDVVEDARRLGKLTGAHVDLVAGNAPGDIFSREPRLLLLSGEGVRLFVCHGHDYSVKYTLDRLSYAASEQNCQMALFGHTHEAFCGYVGDVLLLNPGALRQGRYAILELDNGKMRPFLYSLASGR